MSPSWSHAREALTHKHFLLVSLAHQLYLLPSREACTRASLTCPTQKLRNAPHSLLRAWEKTTLCFVSDNLFHSRFLRFANWRGSKRRKMFTIEQKMFKKITFSKLKAAQASANSPPLWQWGCGHCSPWCNWRPWRCYSCNGTNELAPMSKVNHSIGHMVFSRCSQGTKRSKLLW